jgi:hypothetical protein
MEVKDEAVFENVGQAVHVSFLIMAQEAKQDAPLRAALIRAMESVVLSGRQRCWLDQLRGASTGRINFGGLNGNEVRAQCALVLQAVKHRLPATEMWVLQAKYGETDFEDVDGKRRFAFSAERIDAIKGLSDWFRPLFPSVPSQAIDCMLGRLFANHKQLDITVRDLAASFGGSRMSYQRASKKMQDHLREMERIAFQRLTPSFVAQGVVEVF